MSPKQNLKTYLSEARKIILSTHLQPDGDGLGAETALFHYLKNAGKSCRVCNPDHLPRRYKFLDPKGRFLHGPDHALRHKNWDLWVIVDTNDPARVGQLWKTVAPRVKRIVFLDHHQPLIGARKLDYPAKASIVSDTRASSIGELLFTIMSDLKLTKLNLDIATGLYVSVMTDTNSFRYAGTTPASHRIAAQMIELGVNPEKIYQSIYSSKNVSHVRLLGSLLQNMKHTRSGKIAWLELPLALRKKFNATPDDTHSFLNLLLLIQNVEIICLFREEDDGKTRVSIRSKGKFQVHRVAAELGGGGHEFAAGVALRAPLKKTVDEVVSRLEAELRNKSLGSS
ncbi:MAG: hypothetical protein HYX41_07635 [Bdellovibrio sp.]|nr:hypothetical protein [Bdellovibrio sp.]